MSYNWWDWCGHKSEYLWRKQMGKGIPETEPSLNRQTFWKNIGVEFYSTSCCAAAQDRRKYVAQLAKDNKVDSILELGCLDGANLISILSECPDAKVSGIDINENAIKYGRDVRKNKADMQVGSLYDLSAFEDKSFDIVFTCGVLIHIPDYKIQGILEEMVRIAKYHTFHIELNGASEVQKYADVGGKIPHKSVHPYVELYKNIGIETSACDIITLGVNNKAGARDLVWTSLTDKKMIVDPYRK